MRKTKYTTIGRSIKGMLTAFLLLFALPLLAQDATNDAPLPAVQHRADPERVRQLMQKVEEIKHQKLREILNLDDETAKKFFAQYDPAEKDLIALVKQRQEQELKLLQLTRGDYKDGDVDPTIQSIKMLTQQIQDRYEQLNNNLKSILTPRERAKLLVFEKEFNSKVREKIHDRIERWKENHPGQHPFRHKVGNKPQSTTH
jgi:Spy/CpxP family protein refolding chaperone